METRLDNGTKVRTTEKVLPDSEWSFPEQRRWGVEGEVVDVSETHGVCYKVRHLSDGSLAHYDPSELEAIRLKSLDEHNRDRREAYQRQTKGPWPNGIACPECGKELYDTSVVWQIATNPPKTHIHCKNCDYKGTRIA